ncbi:MAG TPA: hypothetical protein VMW54_15655 [Terriglobia bacterium]|nr:hypothetical protein [Terriglobia bacterium]
MIRTRKQVFQGAVTLSTLLLVLPAVYPAQATEGSKLSPAARQVARIIGAEPLLARLSSLSAAKEPAAAGASLEEMSLHQQITEAVVVASLDVDYTVDQIDNERAQIVELQSIILARRQRAIGTTNLAALAMGTGLGVVSGVLQFSDSTKGVGNAVGFAAGGLSGLLSFHSLRQQHSRVRKTWVLTSMLEPFFSKPAEHSIYPADIWAYLNSVPEGAGSQPSKREQLLAKWSKAGRLPPPASPQFKSKIALVTDTNAGNRRLNMDMLSERSAMLADVRAEVSAMKRVLAEILSEVRTSR